jgi:kynureninase
MNSREHFANLDRRDPLNALRNQFLIGEGTVYLDGNSLGVLPQQTAARVNAVITQEWGTGLIRSWNTAGWMQLAGRIGDKIGQLIGAGPGEVVAADSTSINLYKVLTAALRLQSQQDPERCEILSEIGNFPTDLYMAQGLNDAAGQPYRLRWLTPEELLPALSAQTAVLMLTHVNYKTGRMWDMAAVTQAAHAQGILVIWDLAHSAGAVPVDLHAAQADFAVGCGYKYLNGGPGAPAFVWVHPKHVNQTTQPLSGWLGHAAPFEFTPDYQPATGITRYVCGTPAVLSMAALECGVDTVLAANAVGGMRAVRDKSVALTEAFIALTEERCAGRGLRLASPRAAAERGSQVCLAHPQAYPIMQALIARHVIGDFRAPDVLRFGFTPLYTRYVDVWDAVETLRDVLQTGQWRQAHFERRQAVT